MELYTTIASPAMDARGVLLCLLVPLVGQVLGQVGSLCRPNERFLACGSCQKTCRDPVPACSAVCKTGCYCPEDEVRNDTGECVKLSECPPIVASDLKSSEPRSTDFNCPENEEYRSCEPCNRSCDNPNPICPAQCARGCFCKDGLVRDKDGSCVKIEKCFNFIRESDLGNFVKPLPYQLTCGPHQVYRPCQRCELTCSSPRPICSNICNAGCFCQEGWIKAPSGLCVRSEDCPKAAEESVAGDHEVSIEDCSSDEIYLSCGWCEPSCWDPNPECPRGVCTRGCLCRPPLLRHHSGHCVEPRTCAPQNCSDANEEYVCRYGCEARCDKTTCNSRPRRCQLGCHCKLGLLRDTNGKCVPSNQCSNATYASDDIYVNITRKNVRNPIVATSVFDPIIPSKSAKFNESNDVKPFSLFKSFIIDASPHFNDNKVNNFNKSKDDVIPITKFINPGNIFFKQYVIDPFRESNDPKSFEYSDLKGDLKPVKKLTVDFSRDFIIDPKVLNEDNQKSNDAMSNAFFHNLFFDSMNNNKNAREPKADEGTLNDFILNIIKQIPLPLPPNTPVNYTFVSSPLLTVNKM